MSINCFWRSTKYKYLRILAGGLFISTPCRTHTIIYAVIKDLKQIHTNKLQIIIMKITISTKSETSKPSNRENARKRKKNQQQFSFLLQFYGPITLKQIAVFILFVLCVSYFYTLFSVCAFLSLSVFFLFHSFPAPSSDSYLFGVRILCFRHVSFCL